MSKKMLINATHPEENRVAIVEDGILTELDIEIAGKEQTKGNIYKAAVVRVEPGLQAAFIDYGGERFGFLQMGEIHPSYFRSADGNGDKNRHPRINDVLRRGQELLVQVVKEERGTKGAALTTYLSLPGRFMVFMPESDTKGVSRKIEDESQRKKLKEAMASLDLPEGMGYIVRTAGIGQKKEELRRDFDYLVRVYEKIQDHNRQAKAPALIYKESNLVIRSLRDYFSADMDEVLVDDPRVCEEAKDFFQEVMPEYARLVKLHLEKRPIFSRYQIEEQIETITKNKVLLPSGGSIVIDSTEALVAIDVNSGKMAGEQGVEATAYKTNLEAAAEAARQLRLRDLGGLIVLDFIDMRERKHIREVEKLLKDSLKYDKARVTVGRISQFGLLEMSRQRIKATLAEGAYLPCPHCHGSGRIKSPEAQAIAFLRKIHAAIAKGQIGRVEGEVPLEVATYLLNNKREELLDMERHHQVIIMIKGRPDYIAGQAELSTQKREKEEIPGLEFLPAVAPPPPLVFEPLPGSEVSTLPVNPERAEEKAEGTEEAGRKKRKRKKRKKRPEEVPAAAMEAETPTAEGEPEEALAESEQQAEMDTAGAGDQAAEEGGRKKRRRKRRKKKPEEVLAAPAEETAAAEVPPSEHPEQTAAPLEPAEGSPAEQERKRKRRRKKKKPAADQVTAETGFPETMAASGAESPPALEAADPPPAEIRQTAPAATDVSEIPPKPSRPRPRSRRQAEVPAEPAAGEVHAAAAEEPPAEADKGADQPVRLARPSRRKRPTEATAPAPAPEAPAKQEAPATVGTAEPVDQLKRRPPRKKGPSVKKGPGTETMIQEPD